MGQQFNYGGQAVIEGVMMRGSRVMAVAVRGPDGQIVVHEEPINSPLYNGVLSRIPFVRGLGLLWDSLGLGMRALTFSAKVAAGDEADFEGPLGWGTIIVALGVAVGLFFLAPRFAADALAGLVGAGSPLAGNLIEGVIRLIVVIGYIWLVGRIGEIQRVFAYHGAEHKAINAYEAGDPLTPETIARHPLEHPRCGTGFLLVVVVISALVFSLLGDQPVVLRYLLRIALIPVIASISYEYIRLMARNLKYRVVRWLIAPQLALQRLTTRPPSPDMLEVSIAVLERVLAAENLPLPERAVAVELG